MILYHQIGGRVKCHELAEAFFARVPADPVLRMVYPASLRCAKEGVSTFLVQLLGGPCEYAEQKRTTLSLKEAHARFRIGDRERDAWLRTMMLAMNDVGIQEDARRAMLRMLGEAAGFLVNSGPIRGACPHQAQNSLQQEAVALWQVQLRLEELVLLTREGQVAEALERAQSTEIRRYFERDRAALVSWLALAGGAGEVEFVRHARRELAANPELVTLRVARERTFLHEAALAGAVELVEVLLDMGADPNALDAAGHAPLYFAASYMPSGHTEFSGPALVRALANGGALVDHQAGVKRSGALHQAARRGNTPVAEALLDYGADIELRDSYAETPLRRAVNCMKVQTAQLLLVRGADAFSIGSKGLTPFHAAVNSGRSAAMRELFTSALACRLDLGA